LTSPVCEKCAAYGRQQTHSAARRRDHPQDILFGMDIETGKVLFQRGVPVQFMIFVRGGVDTGEFVLGPDGHIWTHMAAPRSMAAPLVRINPKDAEIQLMGRIRF